MMMKKEKTLRSLSPPLSPQSSNPHFYAFSTFRLDAFFFFVHLLIRLVSRPALTFIRLVFVRVYGRLAFRYSYKRN